MPYRTSRVAAPKAPAEPGIVADMVRQFADRYAFLRELVQNGIDAGATRVVVRIERRDDGAVHTSVEDDGCGMSRKTIEGPLVTLFSSSKESDPSKIGKYGIGFVSVFAIEPEVVEVATRRDDEAWLVRFFGDHTWELQADRPRPGSGTVVRLVHTMDVGQLERHAALAGAALSRWCRHARVPISLHVSDAGSPAAGGARDVNVPLGLPGLVSVSAVEGDERLVASVGPRSGDTGAAAGEEAGPPPADAAPSFAGYYNRGLTLFETTHDDVDLAPVRFKIDSPRLSHTLSRDNVRHDAELARLHARMRRLVLGELAEKVVARVAEAASLAASERSTRASDEHHTLFEAALATPFGRLHASLSVPLVEPIGGAAVMRISDLRSRSRSRVVVADESSPLTRALARVGHPVARGRALAALILRATGSEVLEASQAFACAVRVEMSPADEALAQALVELLRAAGKSLAAAHVAELSGASRGDELRVVDTRETTAVVLAPDAAVKAWSRSSTLFLNASAASVRLARKRALEDPRLAAHLLARLVLLADGPLPAGVVDRFLEDAAEHATAASRHHE